MNVLLTAETGEAEHAVNPLIPHPVEIVLSLIVFGLLYLAIRRFVVCWSKAVPWTTTTG